MTSDFEAYKNEPGAEYTGSIFRDCFGQVLDTQKCEYCGVTKPVQVWKGFENCRDAYYVLMVQVQVKGRTIWRCSECSTDIMNKLEGKGI